ncbi:hypothetical protein [Nocardia puris]|uniref:Mce-associated membrane protein n=1 Tax=Nocardia puris TaxID=208602 RepID=A0A366E1B7_9NOCA|nr:hypothetical protein [Nocardia puris]RBO96097.1 Mce-associated membrane protein [Nocardia puris]
MNGDAGKALDHTPEDEPTAENGSDPTDSTVSALRQGRPSISDRPRAAVSLQLSSIVAGAAIAILIGAVGVLSVILWTTRSDVAATRAGIDNGRRAEQIATDYAVGASNINFQEANVWLEKLKANTTPQLASKFDATTPALHEILVPLRWTSTATPIAAKVTSESGGIYTVHVFLDVTSTNARTPDGARTTVTYTVAVDTNSDWKITDVSGLGGPLPAN